MNNKNTDIKLNSHQKSAVEHKDGPLLIVAGAGTGKTRVITERIKYLIEKGFAKPSEILALTFTEKGASEMLNRVDEIMPIGYEEPWVTTFHSFADRILKEEALEIGLDPQYKIQSFVDSYILLRKNLFKLGLKYFLPLGNPTKFITAILTFFSRLQDEAVDEKEFNKWVNNLTKDTAKEDIGRWSELAKAYKIYQEIKIEESLLDFGDLILWIIKLFKKRPNILDKYKRQFKYILLDEFQDTNFAQFELIQLLAPAKDKPNLMVVGDDSQSIYKFRGAAVSNILDFMDKYKGAKKVYLLKNYRSAQKILDSAYKLIKYNNPDTLEVKLKIDKNLVSQKKEKGESPKVIVLDNAEDEAWAVLEKIITLLEERPEYNYKDFAILARANNHLEAFVSACKRFNLPYQVLGNRGLFSQPEVLALINFLRVCSDTSDNPPLYSLLQSELLNYDHYKILKLLNLAKTKKSSLWEEVVKDEDFSFIVKLVKSGIEDSKKLSMSLVLYDFIVATNYPQNLLKNESVENNLKLGNLNLFFNYLKRFETNEKNSTIAGFIEYLDLMLEAGENPAQAVLEDVDTINLLTVHSAKGMEFKVVFIVNAASDRFPTRKRHDPIEIPEPLIKESLPIGDYHIQEERRLFYVGMTRAGDYLFITLAKNYGGVKEKRPSVFIKEAGIDIPTIKPSNHLFPNLFESKIAPSIVKSQENMVSAASIPFISYSQLNTYKTCPLKYKYRYILNIPTKPSHALTFGQSIHNTLREFHKLGMKGGSITSQKILEIFERQFIPFGYESKEHKLTRFNKGKEILTNYSRSWKQKFGKPRFVEERFKLFTFESPLIGFIDRIDFVNGKYEVIDYKTGLSKDQKIVDKDEQLTIYALAAKESLKITPNKLSLYFIEEDIRIDTQRNEMDLEKEKQEISKVLKEIKKSDFKPITGLHCKFCDFNKICPVYKNYIGY